MAGIIIRSPHFPLTTKDVFLYVISDICQDFPGIEVYLWGVQQVYPPTFPQDALRVM